jgi:hypothetical protein
MPATTMEAATAMEAATTVEGITAVESAAHVTVETAGRPTSCKAASTEAGTACEAASAVESRTAIKPVPPAPAMAPTPAVPRADAEEDAIVKPLRPVIAVGRAGVWVIPVVAVGADRRRTVSGSDADSNAHLRFGRRGHHASQKNHNSQHSQIL